jgi:hypothetical protein
MADRRSAGRRPYVAAVADAVAIVVFVALGRQTHDEGGNAVLGALEVAAPFLIAAALGWLVARAWHTPFEPVTGTIIWVCTVVVGMLLRRFVFDRGTATPFVIVASVATLVLLIGWRLVAQQFTQRRASTGM